MPLPNKAEIFLAMAIPDVDLVTSSLGLIFHEEKLLMVNIRSRGWDIPGGHREAGETPEQTLHRELWEEAAVTLTNVELLAYQKATVLGPEPAGYRYPYPTSYQLFFVGKIAELPTFIPNEEVADRHLIGVEAAREYDWIQRHPGLFGAAVEWLRSSAGEQ